MTHNIKNGDEKLEKEIKTLVSGLTVGAIKNYKHIIFADGRIFLA